MKLTAWTNGGNGYGLKFSKADRDAYIKREWKELILKLENYKDIIVNIAKDSFWDKCPEVISKDIGIWFQKNNIIPWEKGNPTEFNVEITEDNIFSVKLT